MSYTLIKTGAQIDDILVRAQTGGEIDQELALKAPLASPALTGTPTAPTPAEGDSSTKIATTEFVAAAIAGAITDTAGPADVVTIPDGSDAEMLSFKASIKPLQDLHGYDAPWPAGGGKNLLDLSGIASTATVTVTEVDNPSYSIVGTGANVYLNSNRPPKLLPSTSYILTNNVSPIAIRIREYDSDNNLLTTHLTIGTAPLAFTTSASYDHADAYVVIYTVPSTATVIQPMLRLSTEADATFAPYSNICPITGWTGANITHAGKNLFDKTDITDKGYYLDSTGTVQESANAYIAYIRVAEGKTYTCSGLTTNDNLYMCWLDEDKTLISVAGTHINRTITAPTGAYYLGFPAVWNTSLPSCDINTTQIEVGSSASAYEAFASTVIPVSWNDEAGTVYKGEIDFTTGVLTVTSAEVTYDGSNDEGWAVNGGNYKAYIELSTLIKALDYSGLIYCDRLKTLADHNVVELGITAYKDTYGSYPNQNWLYINGLNNVGVSDVGTFRTWLSNSPIQVVYELATPLSYQLDPVAVRSLLGVNNCWTDTGETEIEYKADLKLYIDKKIAEAL